LQRGLPAPLDPRNDSQAHHFSKMNNEEKQARKSRGRGRNPKSAEDLLSEVITVKVSKSQKKALVERSSEAGYELAVYMRNAGLGVKIQPRLKAEQWAEIRRLIGIDNNLNQLTKRLHAAGEKLDEIEKVQKQVKQLLSEL
jgi:myo-inositol catabolism protein IolC